MALMPERVKHRKMQRGNRSGIASRGVTVAFGEFGLQALERCWLDTKQIEAARVALTRFMKRRGKVWLRVFPDKSYTKKPLEVRMGTGKGAVETWVAVIRPAKTGPFTPGGPNSTENGLPNFSVRPSKKRKSTARPLAPQLRKWASHRNSPSVVSSMTSD